MRFFEKPGMVLQGTREGTSCVPEQLALEQTFDNGAAVDRNESAGSSRRCLMNELGEALFAHTALTHDQDGGVESGDLRRTAKRFLHPGAGHTESTFLLVAMPVRTCSFHRLLVLTDRHHVEERCDGRSGRSAICFGIFLGTTRLRSRRQRSQVARQAALSIMAKDRRRFQCSAGAFLIDLASDSAV